MNRRDEILRAAAEASRIAVRFPTGNRTSFDIVGAVTAMDIPLLFRPLKGLWGAALRDGNDYGILVTSQLDQHVQRFTLAHELGHVVLGHHFSLDTDVDFLGRHSSSSLPIQEAAANTFASELLGSKSLMLESAKRHQWKLADLRQPASVYQMSLRLGISYKAACWSLVASGVLRSSRAEIMQSVPVQMQKRALAPRELITNSWADVWAITPADSNTQIEAGPDDLFAVQLQDNASAGYIWELVDTDQSAEVVRDLPKTDQVAYGQSASRIAYVRFQKPGVHRLVFEHRRPWSGASIGVIEVKIDGQGKETDGFPRGLRAESLGLA